MGITDLESLTTQMIMSDKELKIIFRSKIKEALNKVDLTEQMKELMDNCIENANIDISKVLQETLIKKVKEAK
jgi:hypothetical protein